MTAESILGLVIYGYVSLIMVIIGIMQIRKKTPTGFYTGETPPDSTEVADVSGWNRKHGIMWILYGIVMVTGYVLAVIIDDALWSVMLIFAGSVAPIILMIILHHMLVKKYVIKRCKKNT